VSLGPERNEGPSEAIFCGVVPDNLITWQRRTVVQYRSYSTFYEYKLNNDSTVLLQNDLWPVHNSKLCQHALSPAYT